MSHLIPPHTVSCANSQVKQDILLSSVSNDAVILSISVGVVKGETLTNLIWDGELCLLSLSRGVYGCERRGPGMGHLLKTHKQVGFVYDFEKCSDAEEMSKGSFYLEDVRQLVI